MHNRKINEYWFHRLILLAVLGIVASGCAKSIHYTPDPDHAVEHIPEFSSTNEVVLKNVQSSTTEIVYAETSGARFYANLNDWTSVAIEITRRELEKRGMNVIAAPEESTNQKVLKLSVDDADKTVTAATLESTITLRVETGDGLAAMYIGRNKCVFACSHGNQVDGAMMRSVASMLRDPRIIAYLTNTE